MRRYKTFILIISLLVVVATALTLIRADSYGNVAPPLKLTALSMEAGDPDEPTYADSIACGAEVATPYYGWPFMTFKGVGRCVQDGLRLTLYPIGAILNSMLAVCVGIVTYVLLNKIRRQAR